MARCASLLALVVLTGCAASKETVVARLGERYMGQNVDALVIKFGPPTSSFKMNSGQTSYVWQLTSETNIRLNGDSGVARTSYCKVNVIVDQTGVVTRLDTEDANVGPGTIPGAFGLYGSICAQRLGMERK